MYRLWTTESKKCRGITFFLTCTGHLLSRRLQVTWNSADLLCSRRLFCTLVHPEGEMTSLCPILDLRCQASPCYRQVLNLTQMTPVLVLRCFLLTFYFIIMSFIWSFSCSMYVFWTSFSLFPTRDLKEYDCFAPCVCSTLVDQKRADPLKLELAAWWVLGTKTWILCNSNKMAYLLSHFSNSVLLGDLIIIY